MSNKHPKIGLALGGGGAKGLAHIGLIKVLKDAGIPIDYIAGTSMGAIIGGWYAATGDIDLLKELFLGLRKSDVLSPRKILKNKDGILFRNNEIIELVEARLSGKKIAYCKIPFQAVATDVKNGEEVVLKEGGLLEVLRASSAMPLVFNPIELNGKLLMDGGFSNPVPANVVRDMGADFVIAADVSSRWIDVSEEEITPRNIYSIVTNALPALEHQLAQSVLKQADIVLHPPVSRFSWLEFDRSSEIIFEGEGEARANLKNICEKTGCVLPPKTFFEDFVDFLRGND